MKKWTEQSLPYLFILTLLIGIGTFAVYTYYFAESGYLNFSKIVDPELSSYYGTFIGGLIGTMLTFATIIIVWMTFQTQREELSQTKSLINRQQFESTFFSLLQIQRVIKKNIRFDVQDRIASLENNPREKEIFLTGDTFFESAAEDFRYLYDAEGSISPRISVLEKFLNEFEISDETFKKKVRP